MVNCLSVFVCLFVVVVFFKSLLLSSQDCKQIYCVFYTSLSMVNCLSVFVGLFVVVFVFLSFFPYRFSLFALTMLHVTKCTLRRL